MKRVILSKIGVALAVTVVMVVWTICMVQTVYAGDWYLTADPSCGLVAAPKTPEDRHFIRTDRIGEDSSEYLDFIEDEWDNDIGDQS